MRAGHAFYDDDDDFPQTIVPACTAMVLAAPSNHASNLKTTPAPGPASRNTKRAKAGSQHRRIRFARLQEAISESDGSDAAEELSDAARALDEASFDSDIFPQSATVLASQTQARS